MVCLLKLVVSKGKFTQNNNNWVNIYQCQGWVNSLETIPQNTHIPYAHKQKITLALFPIFSNGREKLFKQLRLIRDRDGVRFSAKFARKHP